MFERIEHSTGFFLCSWKRSASSCGNKLKRFTAKQIAGLDQLRTRVYQEHVQDWTAGVQVQDEGAKECLEHAAKLLGIDYKAMELALCFKSLVVRQPIGSCFPKSPLKLLRFLYCRNFNIRKQREISFHTTVEYRFWFFCCFFKQLFLQQIQYLGKYIS